MKRMISFLVCVIILIATFTTAYAATCPDCGSTDAVYMKGTCPTHGGGKFGRYSVGTSGIHLDHTILSFYYCRYYQYECDCGNSWGGRCAITPNGEWICMTCD